MEQNTGLVLCLAIIVGLLFTAVPWGWLIIIGLGLIAALCRWQSTKQALPLFYPWRQGPSVRLWLMAIVAALIASAYFYIRFPYPGPQDISRIVQPQGRSDPVTVVGKVTTLPRRTRSQKAQFQLEAQQVMQKADQRQSSNKTKTVRGKLYVTLSPKRAKNLHPSQTVRVTGWLYRPKRATIPQGFDFATYLTRRGIFAGLSGKRVKIQSEGWPWGGWALRQRLVAAQAHWLGETEGPLLSAMVLGGRAVDLPFATRDAFVEVGLAHALAASGFHVSLLLALVLTLTRPLSDSQRFIVGTVVLLVFGTLSGFAPSVSRAVLMGFASLGALAADRRTQPVGLLLGATVILLALNPLWIWELGFQLSVLATLGLIVTVPSLTQRLDWLPPTIATLIAVPVAATLWTLPLQLYSFGVVPGYSLLANVAATPLLSAITIGGFISAMVGLIWPLAGSALAWLLQIPCSLLVALVTGISHLPGRTLALGTIAIWQLILLYGILIAVWLSPRWQQRWPLAGGLALVIVLLPVWQLQVQRFQVTVFERASPPMMVVQQPGATLVINGGDRFTASQTLRPFLQQRGMDRIDLAIATDTRFRFRAGWQELLQRFPITTLSPTSPRDLTAMTELIAQTETQLLPLQLQETVTLGQVQATVLKQQPAVLHLQIGAKSWLMVNELPNSGQATWLRTADLPPSQIIWWSGSSIPVDLAQQLKPEVVILAARRVNREAIAQLQQTVPQLYWTERDGAIQWTPEAGLEATLPPGEQVF